MVARVQEPLVLTALCSSTPRKIGLMNNTERQRRMANLQPFTGTLNASGDPESEEGYTVRSYNTPIARVTRHPETGRYVASHSQQRFSPTTSRHQNMARSSLPGQAGEPIGEQSWSSIGPHGASAGFRSSGSNASRRSGSRFDQSGAYQSRSSGYTQEGAPGLLITDLLPDYHERVQRVFNDRRNA